MERPSLLDLHELHLEGELGVRGNDAGVATAAVSVVGRAHELGLLSDGPAESNERPH